MEQWRELYFPTDEEDFRKNVMEVASGEAALLELITSAGGRMPGEVTS